MTGTWKPSLVTRSWNVGSKTGGLYLSVGRVVDRNSVKVLTTFFQKLRSLFKDCHFKAVTAEQHRDESVCDAFITWIVFNSIRKRLLEETDVMLKDAFEDARVLEHMPINIRCCTSLSQKPLVGLLQMLYENTLLILSLSSCLISELQLLRLKQYKRGRILLKNMFTETDKVSLELIIRIFIVTEVCICEIKVETEVNGSKDENTHSKGDNRGDVQEEDDWDYDEDYDNEFYNFSDDDDDDEYYDDEEYDGVRDSSRTPSLDNNSVDSNAQLIIKIVKDWIYEDIAINVLDSCYSKDNRITWILLTKSVEILNESCITLALKTRNKLFLQQEACVAVNHASWHFYIGNDLDFSKLKHGIKESLFSPRGRCRMDMISYLLFLTAYSILLVSTLSKTTFHWLEAVVMGYLVTFFVRELDQCCKSLKQCKAYIYDPFNILDQLSIAMAFIAWSLRWAAYVIPEEERLMIAARYLLCLNFMLYMFRFLEFFYQNKLLGPMLVVIRNMVETYINFLLILMIFWVAYSVVSESILFPEKEIKKDILYYVFRRGFWAMMGEYFLDEVEHFSDNACISPNSANSSTKSCATADGRYTIPILLAAYVLFVQILMFNLLVALFNNAISDNEAKRDMIWRYQTFLLTMQYAESKILLPPFLPFIFLLNGKSGNPF
uniref:Ion transport domain-containing protein n=1 Tax=Biomphalaria glabrata TaxID=6526 RepID=A0A2C9LXH9_BIOGL